MQNKNYFLIIILKKFIFLSSVPRFSGFYISMHNSTFFHRYYILNPNVIPKGFVDNKKASELILGTIGLDNMEYRIGHTKV